MSDTHEYFDVRLPGKFKLSDKKITNPIAVGDWVEIDADTQGNWTISHILPRHNYVIRSSPKKKSHSHILAANVDQAILIASLKLPRTSLGFIDRFFVTLESYRIPGVLIINKADLLSDEEIKLANEVMSIYTQIGYGCHLTSFLDQKSIQIFKPLLEGKVSLLSGHSGTGKSTLINLLVPHADQQISAISDYAEKGVHTTTFAEMFELEDQKGFIIDTPGIKELGLAEIESDELSHYFPEMRQYLGTCRFHNCQHINEPGCKVIDAIKSGHIHLNRYESYLSMMLGDDNRR